MRCLSLFVIGAACANFAGCAKDEGPARAEAAAVSRAVDSLRNADNGRKEALLAALRTVPCSVTEVCAVQSFCAAAYEEHVKVLDLIASTKASAATAPAETLKQALATAEAGLARARVQTDTCTTRQGELIRRYRVAR